MVDRIADILADRGDTDVKDIRRAKAVGILATPARAQLMLAEAPAGTGRHDPRRPTRDSCHKPRCSSTWPRRPCCTVPGPARIRSR